MPGEKSSGAREVVLEDRHLFFVFVAVVLLCALFFTLGFVLGRNQATVQQTAAPAAKKPAAEPAASTPAQDLTFYDRVGEKPSQQQEALKPAPPAPAPATKSPAAPASKPAGEYYLQVAALSQEADARRLAQDLEKKGFPVVVRPPSGGTLHRVLVGPLENAELAEAAKRRLEAHGFRPLVVR